jgi:hypothetical protein
MYKKWLLYEDDLSASQSRIKNKEGLKGAAKRHYPIGFSSK